MREKIILLALIALVVGLPMALRRPDQTRVGQADDVLVVVSPNNEAVRRAFDEGFRAYWKQKTGRTVAFDWRAVGGTNDITRYLNAQYANNFRNEWEGTLNRPWSDAIANGFTDARKAASDPEVAAARAAFLAGNTSIGVDISWGGGSYEFAQQAERGQVVASGVEQAHPDWFTPDIFPLTYAGEQLRDPQGRWQGSALSTFGIIYNRERLAATGFTGEPSSWANLADARFANAVALADPNQSGSVAKAFEMIFQQQMQEEQHNLLAQAVPAADAEKRAIAQGWLAGLQLIQLASANAAYFTDSAPRPIMDVAAGDCAIGMAIDFYARIEEESLAQRNPGDPRRANRFHYLMPHGGSSLSADPIALLRGAPHPEVAKAFIEFVLSLDGQKLWDFRAGTPGGPPQALRRSPIRRDLYAAQWQPFLADPTVNPYAETGSFVYQAAWTSPVFTEMRFVIKAAFMDPHPELQAAWKEIRRAQREGRNAAATAALAKLQDFTVIDYAAVRGPIKQALAAGPLSRMAIEAKLDQHFRKQYDEARVLAQKN